MNEIIETLGLITLTSATITNKEQVHAELGTASEHGYSVDWDQ